MALNFPNVSRSYVEAKHCVVFWGYDSAFEIAFEVEEGALMRIRPAPGFDEKSLLKTFDDCRGQIEHAAMKAYARQRHPHYRLSEADF